MYSDDDPDFKRELIKLMIENLEELEQAYYQSSEQKNITILQKAYHKVKTTLSMLDDHELNAIVEDLHDTRLGPAAIHHYRRIRAEITASLLAEK